jgi:signal transduction histidine kinase
MNRPFYTWIVFGLCLVLLLGSMGWVTATVLRLDQESAGARERAVLEENIRLALWRMDSSVAPLIGRENARPYYEYNAFYPAERAYTRMLAKIQPGEVMVPSPLLTDRPPENLLHFQYEPGGLVTSPQVPMGNKRDLAESGYTTHEKIKIAGLKLSMLRKILEQDQLAVLLPNDDKNNQKAAPQLQVAMANEEGEQATSNEGIQWRRDVQSQQVMNTMEWNVRSKKAKQIANMSNVLGTLNTEPNGMEVAPLRAIWMGEALVLARRVTVGGLEFVQGCWLDWPAMKTSLMDDIKDLLPGAQIVPYAGQKDIKQTRQLASLPVALLPGTVKTLTAGLSPIQISLMVAWGCVLLAALAAFVLLRGAVVLSERRGAFVSAVTHELRTPLTTFRMYTEMLEGGMVPDEQKRQRYLVTLRTEAERLDHLVKNVLAYARLEKTAAGGQIESVQVLDLTERIKDQLSDRAGQSDMQLTVELSDPVAATTVRADRAAAERILFNLVDNACKYAADAEDRRIHIGAERRGDMLAVKVRDHGAGIGPEQARRLFKPFSKSAKEAAESAPGVGLGLALSRRLARGMGGDLVLDTSVPDGACFILTLPVKS